MAIGPVAFNLAPLDRADAGELLKRQPGRRAALYRPAVEDLGRPVIS